MAAAEGSAELYCPSCERTFPDGTTCPRDGAKLVRIVVPVDPLIGRDLDGKYRIVEKLGRGGMGAVYRATEYELSREVAIKVVNPALVTDGDVIKRFVREAKLASRLVHPNAVSVLAFGQTDDDLCYLVMELVHGHTLDQVLKADGTLAPDRMVRIATQVCAALAGAHALQIVHRDLKPANIMLIGRDHVKVLDFGLAKSMLATEQSATTMTNAGSLVGTPAYMPPELALGRDCDGRADLYSLGVILYLAGSGRLPFVSESAHELIAMHGADPAPPMTDVPPALARVVDRLLRKDPAERYPTAVATASALEAALDNRYVTPLAFAAQPDPTQTPAPPRATGRRVVVDVPQETVFVRPRRRWVAPLVAAALVAIALVVALCSGWLASAKSRPPAEPPPAAAAAPAIPPAASSDPGSAVAAPANPEPPPTHVEAPPASNDPGSAVAPPANPEPPTPAPPPRPHKTHNAPAKTHTVPTKKAPDPPPPPPDPPPKKKLPF